MFKKRFLAIICLVFAIFALLPITMSDIKAANADGKAEIALELTHGTILYEKNADAILPMASTTKIMTALLIAEKCDLSEVITVPDEAVGVEGSSIYLKYGETLSVKDLLYGLMLRSGNDAATALAIHHSGNVDSFVEAMNEKAKELGAANTHFANPSGLPNDSHYTTARDLCTISRYAMSNKVFAEVVACKNYVGDYRSFTNKNKILKTLDGANGVKTGYTEKAGRCLVSSAKRGNMDVICVVLNCYDMYERSAKIIDECFEKYCLERISNSTVFNYEGKLCTLKDDCTVCIERSKPVRFEVAPLDGTEQIPQAIAKLQIFSENDLIFSEFLYSI